VEVPRLSQQGKKMRKLNDEAAERSRLMREEGAEFEYDEETDTWTRVDD
jgi:hypothetical protein